MSSCSFEALQLKYQSINIYVGSIPTISTQCICSIFIKIQNEDTTLYTYLSATFVGPFLSMNIFVGVFSQTGNVAIFVLCDFAICRFNVV